MMSPNRRAPNIQLTVSDIQVSKFRISNICPNLYPSQPYRIIVFNALTTGIPRYEIVQYAAVVVPPDVPTNNSHDGQFHICVKIVLLFYV